MGSSTALMWEPYLDAPAADAAGSSSSSNSSNSSNSSGCEGVGGAGTTCAAGAHSSSSSSSSSRGAGVDHGTRTISPEDLATLIKGAAGAGLQVRGVCNCIV